MNRNFDEKVGHFPAASSNRLASSLIVLPWECPTPSTNRVLGSSPGPALCIQLNQAAVRHGSGIEVAHVLPVSGQMPDSVPRRRVKGLIYLPQCRRVAG